MNRLRGFPWLMLLTSIWIMSCISRVSLEETPCPCGPGYRCCVALGFCLAEGEHCPSLPPLSTNSPCQDNEACPQSEACHVWTIDGQRSGPGQCRRSCTEETSCAEGETCRLVLQHQDKTLLQTRRLCLPGSADEECAAWTCETCSPERLGRMFCVEDTLYGCLFAPHPRCGLTCQKTRLGACASCKEDHGSIDCAPIGLLPPCIEYKCDRCPATASPYCTEDKVTTCLRASTMSGTCEEACHIATLQSCSEGCMTTPEGSAACSP